MLFEFYVRGLVAIKVARLSVVPLHFDFAILFNNGA